MSDCCPPKAGNRGEISCPACGNNSSLIEKITLLQQVRFPENMKISDDCYYFCADPRCTTAYFSAFHIINKNELVTYAQIRSNWLCYCFDISVQDYQNALNAETRDSIKQFVTGSTQSKLCACRIKNPSGRCCLAKFRELDQILIKSI